MGFDLRAFAQRVRVTDGAWGTQFQKRGLAPGSSPELWNVENPSAVESVAESYIKAGSDVILTNTFGANRLVLASHGLAGRVAELAEAGVRLSRKAAAGKTRMYSEFQGPRGKPADVKIFASLGPTGKIVMMEEVSKEELSAAFGEAAEAMAWGGADAIVLETFNELAEARIALQAVRKATDIPVVVSLTFASGPDKTATMMGDKPADLAKMAEAEGAAAVGANCGVGPDNYVAVARMLRDATDLPVWIKPNAGLPVVDKKGRTTFPMSPPEFAAFVPKLIAAGANFIGGCCGTTPAHIEAVRAAVR